MSSPPARTCRRDDGGRDANRDFTLEMTENGGYTRSRFPHGAGGRVLKTGEEVSMKART